MSYSGLLAVYKPPGMSSKDVSRKLTRVLGKHKMGHVGTLDPIAEGVLPILFGKATRLQDYLLSVKKSYECHLTLGVSTDTLDSEGATVEEASFEHVTSSQIEDEIKGFLGAQSQTPPLYSAVKYKGKPLYKYARENKGSEVPLEELSRQVCIYGFELLSFEDGVIRFSADVSKGTYIRVLAYELARSLGTVGHVSRLIRTESSGIKLAQTVRLDPLLETLSEDEARLNEFFVKLSDIEISLGRIRFLSSQHKDRLFQGQRLTLQLDRDFELGEGFSEELLNSCEGKEVLLEDEKLSLFAIATCSKTYNGFSFKIKKGLV